MTDTYSPPSFLLSGTKYVISTLESFEMLSFIICILVSSNALISSSISILLFVSLAFSFICPSYPVNAAKGAN